MSQFLDRRTFTGMAAASALSLLLPSARAAERPIKLVVGFAPGGTTDLVAREFGRRLEPVIGQPVIVENRPGAGQIVAMQATISGGADGNTLIFGTPGAFSIGPKMYKTLPYDPRKFVLVSPLTTQANILVAHPSFPASSLSELVAYAKSGKRLNYGSLGIGSSVHFAMEMFKKRAGLDIEHVPYKGEAPALLALKGQEVPIGAVTVFGALPRIRSGELKALGVFQTTPDANLPAVQTTAQAGYPEVDMASWMGLFAPPGTPDSAVARLEPAARKVLDSQEFRAFLSGVGNSVHPLEKKAFMSMIDKQAEQVGEIVTALNMQLD